MSTRPPLQTGISNEEWRNLSEFPNYQVSNIGRVRNSITGRILNLSISNCGYVLVQLRKSKKSFMRNVHRLVALAFIENPHNKPCVDHINRLKTDNTITNLRWSTRSENCKNKAKKPTHHLHLSVCVGTKRIRSGRQRLELTNEIKLLDYFPMNSMPLEPSATQRSNITENSQF